MALLFYWQRIRKGSTCFQTVLESLISRAENAASNKPQLILSNMSTSALASHINGFSDTNGHAKSIESPTIINIQQSTKAINLENDIVDGLRSQPKYLPSVLLWTADGLKLFDEVTRTPDYYPNRSEIDILKTHVDDIAQNVVSESVLIELGSG